MAKEAEKKEAGQEQQAATPAAGSSSKKKKLLIAGAVVMLLAGTGAPLGYFLLRKAPSESAEEAVDAEIPPVAHEEPAEPAPEGRQAASAELDEGEELLGAIVPLDAFLVNLLGGKYIRLQVQAELETPDIPRRLYSRIVPIRDEIITHLTQKTAAELEDGAGKDKLKGAIREIMNQQLRREDVRRIYFTQFVIQ